MSHRAGRTSFGPHDLARMGGAFDAALALAADEASPFAVLPALELRARLARAVIAGARRGVHDPDELKAHALRAVAATLATLDETSALAA